MGSCQNYGPFLGTLNSRCRIIVGTQKGTILLTTTHVGFRVQGCGFRGWGLQYRVSSSLDKASLIVESFGLMVLGLGQLIAIKREDLH